MVNALVYTRVSQDRAEGRSVDEQETECRAVCERNGWHVAEVLSDNDVGASRKSKGRRTSWEKVAKQLTAGDIGALVTWEASRAQRDLAAYVQLRDLCESNGVLWSYNGKTHDLADGGDRFTTGLDALLAEREAEETSKRVLRAVASNAAQGRPHGRRLFGYRRVYDSETGRLEGQEIEPTEADTVRRIFAEYAAGSGAKTIARQLNEDGIATSTGAEWKDGQIARLLENPAYIAQRVHRGEVVGEASWPAIIAAETWARVASRRADLKANRRHYTSTARLLTGVARCGVCGSKMHAQHDRNKRKLYSCRGKHCVARDLEKLDMFVSDAIIARLSAPDAVAALHDGPAELSEVTEARNDIAELRGRLDDAADRFAAGELTATMLAKVEQRLQPQIAAAEKRARYTVMPLEIDVPLADLDGWWDGMERAQQREVVNALVDVVEVNRTKQGTRSFDPERVAIRWRQ